MEKMSNDRLGGSLMLPTSITAIVIDTNVFGGPDPVPNVDLIQEWADACARNDAELWISEVVAHELAQHAIEQLGAYHDRLRGYRRLQERCGLDSFTLPPVVAVEEVIESMESAGARIIPLDGASAVEAVRDQVLLRGPAERKKGTKTGAADSAWIRSVIAANGGTLDGLLVVTGDQSALEKVCAAAGTAVPRTAKHIGDIASLVGDGPPTVTAEQEQSFQFWLEKELPEVDLVAVADLATGFVPGRGYWWNRPEDLDPRWEVQIRTVASAAGTLMGPLRFDVWADALTGKVEVLTQVEEEYAGQDEWGDRLETLSVRYPGRIHADLTLFQSQSGGAFMEQLNLIDPDPEEIEYL